MYFENLFISIKLRFSSLKAYFYCISDTLRKYQDASFVQQDINVKEKRKTEHQELTKYWASQQRVEDSRDADLKCGLKGAFQITIAEGDLGPASMQIFQVSIYCVLQKNNGLHSNEWLINNKAAPGFMNREKVLGWIKRGEIKWKGQKKICEHRWITIKEGTWGTSIEVKIIKRAYKHPHNDYRWAYTIHTYSCSKSHACFMLSCTNNHTLPRTVLFARWLWWMLIPLEL